MKTIEACGETITIKYEAQIKIWSVASLTGVLKQTLRVPR
jgi:hypothetical protein